MIQLLATGLALVFPALVIVAAVKDVTSFTIPNWISLSLLAAYPAAALAVGLPATDIALHGGAGLLALLLGMAMFAVRWIGGGDAKLLAAAVLWLGWPAAGVFLAATLVAGGGLSLLLLSLRSPALRPLALGGPRWVARLADPGEGAPYGVAIAIGALAAFPRSPFMAALSAF